MKPRSDLTKILEFWRWSELSRVELSRLTEVAIKRVQCYGAMDTAWGYRMARQWYATVEALIAESCKINEAA
jgi:hypothetical protein